jgi:hypothetical protein
MITLSIRSVMWFSAGVVLAIALLGTSLAWRVSAAGSSPPSSIVAIDPVRILDTRDPVDVGLAGPFVSPVAQKLQVTGPISTTTGTQVVVPAGSTAVLLNVTAVGPSAAGFVSIRPGDASGPPATSSLNVAASATVPNSVQVALPTTGANAGQIDITYDALGVAGPTTDILIDVVGYASPLTAVVPRAFSAHRDNVGTLANNGGSIALSVTVNAPVAGLVQLTGSVLIDPPVAAGVYRCFLTLGAGNTISTGDLGDTDRSETLTTGASGSCATNGAVSVPAGTHVLNLVLGAPVTATDAYDDATLDALFIPGATLTASLTAASDSDD